MLRPRAQGRPCGTLGAWLRLAGKCDCRDDHMDMRNRELKRSIRVATRARIAGAANGVDLFTKERDLRPGEPEEPMRPA